jgi:uncharacterized protein YecE (DUF72 family)
MKIKIPKEYQTSLRIGTCSWKFDSWKGLFYDPSKNYTPDDYLVDYAQQLSSVEIDQWFWSLFPGGVKLPDISTVKTYADSVPDDFVFTVKAPNSLTLTHFYSKQPKKYTEYAGRTNKYFLNIELLEKFLERLTLMGEKLGPIMFQFEYLNKKKMPSKEEFFNRFHEFMLRAPRDHQYAVEIRNPNYLSPAFFEFLEEHALGFVYLEGYYMPPIGDVFNKFQPATADFCIVRLHGGSSRDRDRNRRALESSHLPETRRIKGSRSNRPCQSQEQYSDLCEHQQPFRGECTNHCRTLPRSPQSIIYNL